MTAGEPRRAVMTLANTIPSGRPARPPIEVAVEAREHRGDRDEGHPVHPLERVAVAVVEVELLAPHDADDAEADLADEKRLAQRVLVPEVQPGGGVAEHHDARHAVHVV